MILKKFKKQFDQKPNHLSLLSYDLVGLIYYLSLKNEILEINKSLKQKTHLRVELEFLILMTIKLIID